MPIQKVKTSAIVCASSYLAAIILRHTRLSSSHMWPMDSFRLWQQINSCEIYLGNSTESDRTRNSFDRCCCASLVKCLQLKNTNNELAFSSLSATINNGIKVWHWQEVLSLLVQFKQKKWSGQNSVFLNSGCPVLVHKLDFSTPAQCCTVSMTSNYKENVIIT